MRFGTLRLRAFSTALLLAAINHTAIAAERFSFAALGDMPYRESHFPHFERLIARINAAAPAFTVHVGDFKNGVSFCDDDVYRRMRGLFDRFEAPLIYTPGDNEWTDCHRIGLADRSASDPIERLQHLRSVFYPDNNSLSRKPILLERQSADPRFSKFVENAHWQRGGVHFATVHVVGSNNNLQRNQAALTNTRNATLPIWPGSMQPSTGS
jgi:hypothetical protein